MSQSRNYRCILYRLDLPTRYYHILALVQHITDESPFDGILELKVITGTPSAGLASDPTQLRPPSTIISFRWEEQAVNAIALYGPRSSLKPTTSSLYGRPAASQSSRDPSNFALEIKERYAPRTTLVRVLLALVQHSINEGASTILFESSSYLAESDVAREVRAADAETTEAAAARRESHYHHPQQTTRYYNQNTMYDLNAYQWGD